MALTNKEKEANRDKEKQKQQQHEYYLRVTKVKRQQARAVKEKVEITEPYEFVHKCPVCNKEWTEMTLSVKPQYSKTCAECKVIKAREYTHTEKYRKARREKAFARYHEDEKYRKKVLKKQHKYERKKDVKLRKKEQWAASKKITYMWYNKETNECVMDLPTIETARAFAGVDFDENIHAIVPCKLVFGNNAEIEVYDNASASTRFSSVIEFLSDDLIIDDILEATEETPIRYKYA